jgi:hypothetical protein
MEKGPKRKAKLEPIVKKEEESEEEEGKEKKKCITRQYKIIRHNESNIFLSSVDQAHDPDWIRKNNIRFILNVSKKLANVMETKDEDGRVVPTNYFFPGGTSGNWAPITYKRIPVKDESKAKTLMEAYIPDAIDWIHERSLDYARRTSRGRLMYPLLGVNTGILVHCNLGKSRSPTVLASFLMRYEDFNMKTALLFLEAKVMRPLTINAGFMEVLRNFELDTLGIQTVSLERTSRRASAVKGESTRRTREDREKRRRFYHIRSKDKVLGRLAHSSESGEEEDGEDKSLVGKMGAIRVSGEQREEEEEDFDCLF